MSVLEYIPAEILRQIISCLDRFELSQISLVSHFFKSTAEPFLYASLGCYPGWLTPSLRAIVTRPAMARHVRHVLFAWWTSNTLGPDSDDSALFCAAARQLGLSDTQWRISLPDTPWSEDAQPWTEEPQSWSEEAQALLLLHLLPNIRYMSISGSPLLASFFESTLTIPIENLPFKTLRKFDADQYSRYSSVNIPMLLALMRFPSLREVAIDMQFIEADTNNKSVITSVIAFARESPITHLSLNFGNTSPSMLEPILRMPLALTHFSYADDNQYPYIPNTTPLRSALRALSPTLQSLTLDGLRALQLGEPGEQTIGTLSDWPALTTVKCSLPALVGTRVTATSRLVDLLPMGLRELHLCRTERLSALKSDCEWTVSEMTDQLVQVLQSRELVRLTVDTCSSMFTCEGGWVNVYLAEVKERFAAASGARRLYVVVT